MGYGVFNETCSITTEVREEIIKIYKNLLKKGMERSSLTLVIPKLSFSPVMVPWTNIQKRKEGKMYTWQTRVPQFDRI